MADRSFRTEMTYEKVWPSSIIGDDEKTNIQQRGELLFEYGVEFATIIYALDELGIELEECRFETVGAVGGLAVLMKVERE